MSDQQEKERIQRMVDEAMKKWDRQQATLFACAIAALFFVMVRLTSDEPWTETALGAVVMGVFSWPVIYSICRDSWSGPRYPDDGGP